MSARVLRLAHAVVLAVLCFVAYSNTYDHAFHLDDGHVLSTNPAIRDLKNIPAFFVDPGMFSSLRANVDYRPVLMSTYALNHWLGGYDMWNWHVTQILLHWAVACGLYALCLRIQQRSSPAPSGTVAAWTAFVAAAVFAVHPTGSGVVNYQSARSSLLTAAFLLPAMLSYTRCVPGPGYGRTMWLTALFFALALFTKIEAIGCLAVFFLYDCWQTSRAGTEPSGFVASVLRTANGTTLRRLWPCLAVAVAYFVIRRVLMAEYVLAQSSRRADVTHLDYFLTQWVAWWYYVRHWFAPVGLVADHGAFTVFRSLFDGHVLLALGGWMLVGSGAAALWKRQPRFLFIALSALALVSPTSSIVPLAEMVNEHRPYLPLAVLSLLWTIPAVELAAASIASRRLMLGAYASSLAFVVAGLTLMTLERNKVFQTYEAYWKDVAEKAPSSRSLCNYGLAFMQRAEYATAIKYFREAIELGPYWHIPQINLAVALDSTGESDLALEHYSRGIDYDTFSGSALTWRGRYYLKHRQYELARKDFEASVAKKSLERYDNNKGLATAWAGLGNAQRCFEYTLACYEIDPNQTAIDIVAIVAPFFLDPSDPRYQEVARIGVQFFELLNTRIQDTWWVYANMSALASRVGRAEEARRWLQKSNELKGQLQKAQQPE
jgi:tetratricopeptide (TPR) repeat protein